MHHPNGPPIPVIVIIPTGSCHGDSCQSSRNFLIPLIISLVALVLVILLGIFIIWYYLRRRNRKRNEISKTPAIQLIDQPPLYKDTIKTNNTEMTDKLSSA